MGGRLEFQTLLEALLGSDHVYFQPPETVKMEYPCIVYGLTNVNAIFADDIPYKHKKRYQVTVIDADPDSTLPDKVSNLPMSKFDRHYTVDNLNHYIYNIYY